MHRFFSVCFLCFLTFQSSAQDTVFYKEPAKKTHKFKKCDYFVVTNKVDPRGVNQTKFSKEGIRLMELYTTDSQAHADFCGFDQMNGRLRIWYASGRLQSQRNYKAGLLEKQLISYWPNGKIKRNDFFQDDTCTAGKCFDSTGLEIPHFPFRVMPSFPGGPGALNRFLSTNLEYPESDVQKGIEGRVLVQFQVNPQGDIEDIYIRRSPSPDMSREVLRLLRQMPHWMPGAIDGEAVKVYYTLPVVFKLR